MVFTLKVIVKLPKEQRIKNYSEVIKGGADIILSDKIDEPSQGIYEMRINN